MSNLRHSDIDPGMPTAELTKIIFVAVWQTVTTLLRPTRTSDKVKNDDIAKSYHYTAMPSPTFDIDKSTYSLDECLTEITRLKETILTIEDWFFFVEIRNVIALCNLLQ